MVFCATVSLNLDFLEWGMTLSMRPEQYGEADTNWTSPYTVPEALLADPPSTMLQEN